MIMRTEEECYYPDGIDLAEFCWVYEEQDDGCFRAWPVQWSWSRTRTPKAR